MPRVEDYKEALEQGESVSAANAEALLLLRTRTRHTHARTHTLAHAHAQTARDGQITKRNHGALHLMHGWCASGQESAIILLSSPDLIK
jgi:hypothetical protein